MYTLASMADLFGMDGLLVIGVGVLIVYFVIRIHERLRALELRVKNLEAEKVPAEVEERP